MKVPVYNNTQVALQPAQQAPAPRDFSGDQQAQVGQGLAQAGESFDRIATQEATTEAFSAEAKAKNAWVEYSTQLQQARQGGNAKGVAKDVDAWWTENSARFSGEASNGMAQRMIQRSLDRHRANAVEQFGQYEVRQGEIAGDAAFAANVSSSVSAMAADPSDKNIALHRGNIDAAVKHQAAIKGWLPEETNDKLSRAHSGATIAAFNTLLVRSPTEARTFWSANRESVRGEMRDEIETRLKTAVAGVEGREGVDGIWKALGPKTDMDPVQLDVMADALRARFKDQPETLKAALADVRERTVEHNSSQAERAANSTNTVMAIYAKTGSLAAAKRDPAWAALPAKQQVAIEEHVQDRQTAALNRANAGTQRELLAEQREQSKLRLRGFAAYLEYGKPENLVAMSDGQVQALLPSLGNELTEHLMNKRRQLITSDAVRDATIDKQTFEAIAHEMKLKPYETNKSEDAKAALGTLQYRVEKVIEQAQRDSKLPLPREAKEQLMRQEMSRQVLVNGFFSNSKVPVIMLDGNQRDDVIVPAEAVKELKGAMAAMRAKRPNDPAYADTPDNLRRWYLRRVSPTADLIPNAQ